MNNSPPLYQNNASNSPQFTVRSGEVQAVQPVPIMNPQTGVNTIQINRVQAPIGQNNTNESDNDPDNDSNYLPLKRSSKHVIYAIEILVFTVAGWGWLAVREFMGATPVMDVSVLFCLLISSTSTPVDLNTTQHTQKCSASPGLVFSLLCSV